MQGKDQRNKFSAESRESQGSKASRSARPHGTASLVADVYGWLSLACSGTTRGMRNRPFDAVLLWRDRGNRKVPSVGWAAREDQ